MAKRPQVMALDYMPAGERLWGCCSTCTVAKDSKLEKENTSMAKQPKHRARLAQDEATSVSALFAALISYLDGKIPDEDMAKLKAVQADTVGDEDDMPIKGQGGAAPAAFDNLPPSMRAEAKRRAAMAQSGADAGFASRFPDAGRIKTV